MKRFFSTPNLIFYSIIGLMIAMSVLSFVCALGWINRPFAGFLIYDFPRVGSFGNQDWAGYAAGLKFMDRIISVDGRALEYGRQLVAWIGAKQAGTPVHYLVESRGAIREVVLPVGLFSVTDYLIVFLVPFIFGVAVYALGCIVYVLKPNTHISWIFLVMCFALGTYVATGFEIQSSYHLVYIHYLIIPLVPAAIFHLFSVYPGRKKFIVRHPFLEYAVHVPVAAISLSYLLFLIASNTGIALPKVLQPLVITPVNRLFFNVCAAGIVILMVHSVVKASEPLARSRARMILFGFSLAFVPTVTIMAVVMFMKVTFPWNLMVFPGFFFPASIAYSIVKHNMFEADVIIKRTVGYAIVTLIVVSVYVGVSLALNLVAGRFQLAQSSAFPILFTFGIILIFNPMRDRVQTMVDRVFFRKEYDYGEIIDRIGGAITSLLDLKEILNHLVQTFVNDMFISTGAIMLLDSAGGQYRVHLAAGEHEGDVEKTVFSREDPLMQILEGEKRELTRYDVLEDPKYKEVCEACTIGFDTARASLMVPMVFQDQVIGLMGLGDKKSGKVFNREDVDLLHTLANQGAVAIENARLFQENLEKQRMEEELNIARDLQMSMLPAACPEMAGLDIAAFSVPAREVGGDFYDFIEMGGSKLGIVIGDVTGKSVSGALVMAAARSVFRMLSEQSLPVGDIMNYANTRTKKDIKSGMFVALLYVVVDGQERTLRLCSAGQTQPIRFSSETRSTDLIETEGDTFPLGILDEVSYQETRIQLDSGDKLVFYTDGIVEAMNEKGEIFGFDRLLGVVKSGSPMSADELLKTILDKVHEFVGSADQHDDLTVIVVSMEG
jgi:sigma-B regulation protein RsbU (phosphoserine phosphatase)